MDQLLGSLGTLILSVGSVVAYSFMTFATKKDLAQMKDDSKTELFGMKEEFKSLKGDMDNRLIRIENKLDRLIERER